MRIGAIEAVLHSWLVPVLERLRERHCSVELELSVEATPILLDQLHRGALDLVFAALPASASGVRSNTLSPLEMVFVGGPSAERLQHYSLCALAQLDILTFQRGSQPHTAVMDLFRREQVTPRHIHPISSISAMAQLVEAGFGIATLPRTAAARFIERGSLHELLCPFALAPLPVYASHRTHAAHPLVQAVVQDACACALTRRE